MVLSDKLRKLANVFWVKPFAVLICCILRPYFSTGLSDPGGSVAESSFCSLEILGVLGWTLRVETLEDLLELNTTGFQFWCSWVCIIINKLGN